MYLRSLLGFHVVAVFKLEEDPSGWTVAVGEMQVMTPPDSILEWKAFRNEPKLEHGPTPISSRRPSTTPLVS